MKGLLRAAERVAVGWKCASLETGGITVSEACAVFEAAKSIRLVELFVCCDNDLTARRRIQNCSHLTRFEVEATLRELRLG